MLYKMKLFLILLVIVGSSLYGKNKVYTYDKQENGMISIYLVNNNLFDITFKYHPTYTGLIPLDDFPIHQSIKAKSSKKLTTFMSRGKYSIKGGVRWTIGNKTVFHNNNYLYRLPYALNTAQMVTQGFNGKFSHHGNSKYAVDFGLKVGTKIYASREGIVVLYKNDGRRHGTSKKYLKEANSITIKHSDGTYAKYVHLKKGGVKVHLGQKIKRGEFIGYSGNTGFTNGPHLHFVVFKAKDYKSRTPIAVKFKTKQGILTNPIRGKKYIAVK